MSNHHNYGLDLEDPRNSVERDQAILKHAFWKLNVKRLHSKWAEVSVGQTHPVRHFLTLPNSLENHHVFNNPRLPKRGNIPDRAVEQIEHLLKHNRIAFLATAMKYNFLLIKLKFKVSIVDMVILPRNNIL